jgi:hypothetical protein
VLREMNAFIVGLPGTPVSSKGTASY